MTSETTVIDFIDRSMDGLFSDGLPIVPPTADAVNAFVLASGLEAGTFLGEFRPRQSRVTVRDVAVNAVMAGCKADYAPVVVAAARALMDESFDVWGIACSTKGSAPLIIVNGPVRGAIGLNCRTNVFGPGFRANATIGRAVRLMILNLGGARPDELDKATLGNPGRFSQCIGEDEEDSPWVPLHVERGYAPEQSAVTVFGGESLRLVNVHYNSADALLAAMAETLAVCGILNANNITGLSPHVLVFAKEHRDLLHAAGWSKESIRNYMAENAIIPEARLRQVDGVSVEPRRVVEDPNQLLIVAAGGFAGRFAGILPGWSWQSQPVTVAVEPLPR